MTIYRLKHSGAFETAEPQSLTEIPSSLDKRARFVYAGRFMSMDGEVEVTREQLEKLVGSYNKGLAKLKRLANGAPRLMQPVQLDHTRSAKDTIGRLVGELSLEDWEMDDGTVVPAVYGNLRILGRENVERVLDGRWSELSIGADFEAGEVSELSVTPFPAAVGSSLLSKKGDDGEDDKLSKEEDAVNREKLKKYLTGEKKMSEEDAEKELNRLANAKDKDELKKLSDEADEHEKKLAEGKEEEDKKLSDGEEEEKKKKEDKLSAARASIKRLSTDFRAKAANANLALRSTKIMHRLSGLRSSGKVTPAEIKKMNVAELAGKSDEAVEAVLKSFEQRQPVIMVGAFGSMKAMSHGQLEDMAKQKRMRQLMAESRKNFSSLAQGDAPADKDQNDAEDKLSEPSIHLDTESQANVDLAALESEYTSVCGLIDEGKTDEVKARLKTWMGRMAASGAFAVPEPTVHEESGAKLSALAADIAQLQAQFDEALGLAESLAS